jgi:hypothetical protein
VRPAGAKTNGKIATSKTNLRLKILMALSRPSARTTCDGATVPKKNIPNVSYLPCGKSNRPSNSVLPGMAELMVAMMAAAMMLMR